MHFSEADYGCKKHSNHLEHQGVCPSCLRERLSRLTSVSHKKASRVALSLYFCPADSNYASPAQHRIFHNRNSFMGMSSSSTLKVGTSNGLKKSKSIASVPRNLDDHEEARIGKSKKGFLSKWIHLPFKEK
ncbi:LMBR1-like membrane protein isoform 1 [Hibiscus syriacus]|uniref:LMBR1-like membrane protein isoform 1 n=1 Tax=Hibiscus syriacus TaxID=106335 RepID=A0A6A3C0M1_HIBSY|nr:uncharacterized protein LOC120206794 [Hibiscus syriacus]KAE8722364.1 LMBR1-like membrane protein isoform 1 [Hibiscus syriacus]